MAVTGKSKKHSLNISEQNALKALGSPQKHRGKQESRESGQLPRTCSDSRLEGRTGAFPAEILRFCGHCWRHHCWLKQCAWKVVCRTEPAPQTTGRQPPTPLGATRHPLLPPHPSPRAHLCRDTGAAVTRPHGIFSGVLRALRTPWEDNAFRPPPLAPHPRIGSQERRHRRWERSRVCRELGPGGRPPRGSYRATAPAGTVPEDSGRNEPADAWSLHTEPPQAQLPWR